MVKVSAGPLSVISLAISLQISTNRHRIRSISHHSRNCLEIRLGNPHCIHVPQFVQVDGLPWSIGLRNLSVHAAALSLSSPQSNSAISAHEVRRRPAPYVFVAFEP